MRAALQSKASRALCCLALVTTGAVKHLCDAAGGETASHPAVRAAACSALHAASPVLAECGQDTVPQVLGAMARALSDALPALEQAQQAASMPVGARGGTGGSGLRRWAGADAAAALRALQIADRVLQEGSDFGEDEDEDSDFEEEEGLGGGVVVGAIGSPLVRAAILSAATTYMDAGDLPAASDAAGGVDQAMSGAGCSEEDVGELEREAMDGLLASARTAVLCCAGAVVELSAAARALDVGEGEQPAEQVLDRAAHAVEPVVSSSG